MPPQGRMTQMLLKPFINIEQFRTLLVSKLEVSFTVEPDMPTSRVGTFASRYSMALLRPRSVVVRCLTFFLRHQISKMDFFDLLRDIFGGLGSDLAAIQKRYSAAASS
mmetsp:Transcript_11076/g.35288  ORF Transcript_11076/g.35288 Transcript_11076/m.35288 type:complete len:108 (-) Transcript_11076:9-332(-)